MQGEPLDVQRLLWTPEGQAAPLDRLDRASLSDSERMFFVTHAAQRDSVAWMRTQAGSDEPAGACSTWTRSSATSRRSKQPAEQDARCSRCMKQARAFGLGVRASDAEPRGPRLQRLVERRHVVLGPAANRARQGPRDRRLGGRLGRSGGGVQSGQDGGHAGRARQPGVPDEQCARQRPHGVPHAVGDVRTWRGRSPARTFRG